MINKIHGPIVIVNVVMKLMIVKMKTILKETLKLFQMISMRRKIVMRYNVRTTKNLMRKMRRKKMQTLMRVQNSSQIA
jgi:ribosomal protein S10